MNKNILDKVIQEYINNNINTDVNQIALSKSSFDKVSSAELAMQIIAKKKAEKKLPTWFSCERIYYPPSLSIEQTSSEITAKYKSMLAVGNRLIDLTGGFGVDSFYFSKKVKHVTHCEINKELSEIAKYNALQLNASNITFLAEDGIEYLKKTDVIFDTIYIDPARRAEKGKVFMLKDCTPDVVSNLKIFLSKSQRIIIKTAPLLDISAGLQELKQVSEIHIISVKNECKELLWIIDKEYSTETKIFAITLNETEKSFSFIKSETNNEVKFATEILVDDYLYEPDAALLKSGAFNLIGKQYNLLKLHPQSHLYTSKEFNTEFAGRIFKIEKIYTAGDLKKIKNLAGNVIIRNYPAKPVDLVKKFKIGSSKDNFLIFTKIVNGDNIVISAQIKQYY